MNSKSSKRLTLRDEPFLAYGFELQMTYIGACRRSVNKKKTGSAPAAGYSVKRAWREYTPTTKALPASSLYLNLNGP